MAIFDFTVKYYTSQAKLETVTDFIAAKRELNANQALLDEASLSLGLYSQFLEESEANGESRVKRAIIYQDIKQAGEQE